jgi:HrpA-like RNA helicase
VDADFAKRRSFSSLAETRQRAGPAGRETPGRCWRLYQELAYEQRPIAAEHEI